MKIKNIDAMEILTSQGSSTACVEIELENGDEFSASSGYGTSRSGYEMAVRGKIEDLEENAFFSAYNFDLWKKSSTIFDVIKNTDINLEKMDRILCELDGTPDKSNLGMPLILSTSMAVAKAEAEEEGLFLFEYIAKKVDRPNSQNYSLPVPLINIINGGVHSQSSTIPIQEILLIPDNASDQNTSFSRSILNAQKIFFELQKLLKKRSVFHGYGLEGGIVAPFDSVEQALDLLTESIINCGLSEAFYLGFDCAANQWYDKKSNRYSLIKNGKRYSSDQLMRWYLDLSSQYNIVYFEDPFAEDDFDSWALFKEQYKGKIVGDDLCATNVNYIEKAVEKDCINSVIIKPSQAGTVTETFEAVKAARSKGLAVVVSHRSAETDEKFIMHFALGIWADFCKFGNITNLNIVRYNELLKWDYDTIWDVVMKMLREEQMKKNPDFEVEMQALRDSSNSENEHAV